MVTFNSDLTVKNTPFSHDFFERWIDDCAPQYVDMQPEIPWATRSDKADTPAQHSDHGVYEACQAARDGSVVVT